MPLHLLIYVRNSTKSFDSHLRLISPNSFDLANHNIFIRAIYGLQTPSVSVVRLHYLFPHLWRPTERKGETLMLPYPYKLCHDDALARRKHFNDSTIGIIVDNSSTNYIAHPQEYPQHYPELDHRQPSHHQHNLDHSRARQPHFRVLRSTLSLGPIPP